MISFLRYRYFFYGLSIALAVAGVVSIVIFGLSFSNEFTGGSLLEVEFTHGRPQQEDIANALKDINLGGITIQPSSGGTYILRFHSVDEVTHQKIVVALGAMNKGSVTEHRFEAIGPTIGRELRSISIWTTITALISIFIYLFIAFRKVPPRLGAHKFALIVIITLLHDVIITLGLVSIINIFTPLEIGVPVLAAFLVIAGYSINDTIIVFDRIRERAAREAGQDLRTQIDQAIMATLRRSLFTSTTTMLSLIAIFLFGGETLKVFSLALIIGIIIGTYSSVGIASPLLYTLTFSPLLSTGKRVRRQRQI